MSQNNNQTLVIGLVVVAVLLAGVAGFVIYQQNQAVPAASPTAQADPNAAAGATDAAAGATGAMGGTTGEAAPTAESVDPAAATEVPKGTEPEAFVKAYYDACDKGEWETAFAALPADKKAGNSPDALKEQVTGYGIEGYEITSAEVQGDTATIKVDQVTGQFGTFENTWTLAKKDGVWYVTGKSVTGMK